MKVVFVIAEKDFRDEELLVPKKILESKGIECVVASKTKGLHKGMLGAVVEAGFSLKEIGNDFDGIVFVGGIGAQQYLNDNEAFSLAKGFALSGRIVAAICLAPVILANAGLLNGKKAAVFPSEKNSLVSKGADYSDSGVVVDGKIITASGPSAAQKFGEEVVKALGK